MQQATPLISVIIPVYNGSGYIEPLLAHFQSQTTQDVELLFVDDGSGDDSYEKLLACQERGQLPIQVFHRENGGVSAARNFGVEKATGTYVTFFDVDDRPAPDYLDCLRAYAQRGVSVLVFDSQKIREQDAVRPSGQPKSARELTGQEMLGEFWTDPTRFGVCNLLVKKHCLMGQSIRFSAGYAYYEDYDYLLQLFAQVDTVARLDRVLYYYVLREGSAMGRFGAARINCLELMKRREQWLEEKAPEFAPVFRQWGISRLYWSVLWQAALAFPRYRDFRRFARKTGARQYLKKLKGYSDRLLQASTAVYLCCPPLYHLAVGLVGKRRSKVGSADLEQILSDITGDGVYY